MASVLGLGGSGCGSFDSGKPIDSGTDVRGAGGAMSTGGRGGALGLGGASAGGAAGTGAGGAAGSAAVDAGVDVNLTCVDAGYEGGTGDMDFDGTADCLDGCPIDPGKIAPGVCGCGVPDSDDDGDGVLNCNDRCPGAPDVDTDNDGVIDCLDACPKDPGRTTAGLCGCGVPETTPLCLVHRYSFNDTTATIADSITIAGGISPKNGMAMGTSVPANGRIVLTGGLSTQIGGQFVSLPSGMISVLGNTATFEAWVTWNPVVNVSSGPWQRIFDFGNSDQATPGIPGTGQSYLFLSPANGVNNLVRTAFTLISNGGEDLIDGTASLPTNTTLPVHVAVVVNGTTKMMSLYVNGVANGPSVALRPGLTLSNLKDVNNWIGRSQWAGDQLFGGSVFEFRIYGAALSAAQINASFSAGPDTLPATVDGGTTDDASTVDAGTDTASTVDAGTDTPTSADAGTDTASGQ